MEKLLTQEDIRQLKELNARLKKELLPFGITLDAVPEQLSQQMDEYIEIQLRTGLSDLDELTLREYYLNKKSQQLDQRLAASKLRTEVEDLKNQIEMENKECEVLEKFIKKYSNVKEDYQPTKLFLKKKLQSLQAQQENFTVGNDVNIEELIKKIEILKQREADSKK